MNILIAFLSLAVMGMSGAIYRQFSDERRVAALGDVSKLLGGHLMPQEL